MPHKDPERRRAYRRTYNRGWKAKQAPCAGRVSGGCPRQHQERPALARVWRQPGHVVSSVSRCYYACVRREAPNLNCQGALSWDTSLRIIIKCLPRKPPRLSHGFALNSCCLQFTQASLLCPEARCSPRRTAKGSSVRRSPFQRQHHQFPVWRKHHMLAL
jgi:hypothetical protein